MGEPTISEGNAGFADLQPAGFHFRSTVDPSLSEANPFGCIEIRPLWPRFSRLNMPFAMIRFTELIRYGALATLPFLFTACGDSSSEEDTDPADTTEVTDAPADAIEQVTGTVPPPPPMVETPETADDESEPDLSSVEARASYGIGYNLAGNIMTQGGLELDTDALNAGIEDAMAEMQPRLSQSELEAAFTTLQERVAAEAEAAGAANMAEAQAFLAENAQRSEVTVTDSGLQYEVLSEGPEDAPSPTPDDTVQVHYHGTLPDGTVFDSSVQRGEPISFPVTGVIPGWVEALQLMSVGDKYKLFIPPDLAYGARGAGQIPPNSALVFEVELLDIERGTGTPPPAPPSGPDGEPAS